MQDTNKSTTNNFINKILGVSFIKKIISVYNFSEKMVLKNCNKFAKILSKKGVSANFVSVIGFIIGMFAVNFLSYEHYLYALLFIILNRIFDMFDGAIAKASSPTKFGMFLDYLLDYIFYSAVIFGFALARIDQNAIYASFMLFAFLISSISIFIYALIDYQNSIAPEKNKPFYFKAVHQGGETILAIILSCIFPSYFYIFAIIAGVVSIIKTMSLITLAYYKLEILERRKK